MSLLRIPTQFQSLHGRHQGMLVAVPEDTGSIHLNSSSILESLPSQLTNDVDTLSFMERILAQDDICNHDAIILVEHPGVCAFA